MSDGLHLLIPFASCAADGCRQALRQLRLPHLVQLLARWQEEAPDAGTAQSLSPPQERVLARTRGWPVADGLVPLAAWDAQQAGLPGTEGGWARITPCHWRVGTDHVAMADPGELQLDAAQSQALHACVAPYFEQDGLALHYHGPLLWLAQGALFDGLPTASLDRVIGREIDSWMPRSEAARPLRRLQQEMQMLMYTLPMNDERQARGQLPVNSLWVSGTGRLPAQGAPTAGPQVDARLRAAAMRDDWPAWSAAWQQLDAELRECHSRPPPARRAGSGGNPGRSFSRITLCGERSARTWSASGTRSLAQRLGAMWRTPSIIETLESL